MATISSSPGGALGRERMVCVSLPVYMKQIETHPPLWCMYTEITGLRRKLDTHLAPGTASMRSEWQVVLTALDCSKACPTLSSVRLASVLVCGIAPISMHLCTPTNRRTRADHGKSSACM